MKKSFFIFSILLVSLISYLLSPFPVSAQLGIGLSSSDISVTLDPENPYPNQTVNVSIESFATDLNAATISWLVNGKKVVSGKGIKQISVTVGKLGVKTNVVINIDTLTASIQKTISIIPATVDIIWEAKTYTPPFFKGRPLFTAESTVNIIALPHLVRNGVEVSPSNLIYKWEINGSVLGDRGGYGKNSLTIIGTILPRPMDLHVEATDPQSNLLATGDTTLTPGKPFILIYKNDPLYGVQYQKALTGTFSLSEREVELFAVPYYFSVNSAFDNNISYNWEINGVPIADGINNPNKIFRQVSDIYGTSNISLSAAINDTLFQTANTSLLINFQKPTNITGF